VRQKIIFNTITFGLLYGNITGLLSANGLTAEPDLALTRVVAALYPVWRPEREYLFGLPLLLMPFFFIIMFSGGFMRKDLARSGVFSFTRYQNRHVWYFCKSFMVMVAGFLYPIAYISGFSGIAMLVGARFDWTGAVRQFAAYILCSAPAFSLAVLSCNFLSIRYGTHIAAVIMMAALLLLFLIAFLLWNQASAAAIWLYRLNPLAGSVAAWRDLPRLGFNLSLGFIIQLVQMAGLLAVGWRYIRKMDIISETEEGL
jgi:hypothetical protein